MYVVLRHRLITCTSATGNSTPIDKRLLIPTVPGALNLSDPGLSTCHAVPQPLCSDRQRSSQHSERYSDSLNVTVGGGGARVGGIPPPALLAATLHPRKWRFTHCIAGRNSSTEQLAPEPGKSKAVRGTGQDGFSPAGLGRCPCSPAAACPGRPHSTQLSCRTGTSQSHL